MSMWVSMISWFTPTVLFCVLQLMIATIFIASNFNHRRHHRLGGDNPPQVARVPSFLDRVRSFNLSQYTHPFPPQTHHTDPQDDDYQTHHVTRSKSDACSEAPAMVPEKMRKSASEKTVAAPREEEGEEEVDQRRPETVRETKETASCGEDEEVDAKADDFINRFKQQLKLQRLDSLMRYNDMLRRGSGN